MSEVSPIVFHRGAFVDYRQAGLEIQDRGVLFGDGVYEVVRLDRGRWFAMQPHVDRLASSLAGIGLDGVDAQDFVEWSDELVKRNGLTDAKVYWQVTRGPATRDFVMPQDPSPTITLLAFPAQPIQRDAPLSSGPGMIAEDCRWTRCSIKSLMLLPASMAKTAAKKAGAVEAIFEREKPGVNGKHITEGSSTNVFIVRNGTLMTHPDNGWVLGGITRVALLELAGDLGIPVQSDQPFTRADLLAADEVFVCSTTQLNAITSIVGEGDIANGQPGEITQRLHEAYLGAILNV